jgi:hypothetical protein
MQGFEGGNPCEPQGLRFSNIMKPFMAVGNALLTIQDNKLYRQEFKTFNDYCNERWGLSKSQTNRLMSVAKVAANLSPIGELCAPCASQPTSEFQIRLNFVG